MATQKNKQASQAQTRPDLPPPQDLLAEQVTLGCCLLDREAVKRVVAQCRESDFIPEAHQLIYRAILSLHLREEPVDMITVAAALRRLGRLEDAGSAAYLSALQNEVPTTAHVSLYAAKVAELGALRELAEAGRALWARTREHEATLQDVLEFAEAQIAAVRARANGAGVAHVRASVLAGIIGETRWLWPGWIPTGFLSALVGDKGKGKSTLALWFALTVTGQLPWPDGTSPGEPGEVLWLDTEGRQGLLLERIAKWGLSADAIHLPGATGMEVPRLDEKAGIAQVIALTKAIKPALVVVDSVSGGHGADENSSGIRVFLKALAEDVARDLGTAVLAVHHFGKPQAVPGRPRRREEATMADARGSNAFEQLIVSGMVLDRPDWESEVQRLRVDVSNLCEPPPALGFMLEEGFPTFPDAPQPPRALSATENARTFLREFLSRGEKAAIEVEQAALQHGHKLTRTALRSACKPARDWQGIAVRTERGIEWWGLPATQGGYG